MTFADFASSYADFLSSFVLLNIVYLSGLKSWAITKDLQHLFPSLLFD